MRIAQITDTHLTLDVPSRTGDLARCVAQINALDPLPDLVIHSGDVSHHGLPGEYGVARDIMEQLKAPWFVMAGNKDKRAAMIEAFSQRGIPRSDFPFVQYAVDQSGWRVVCLDTVSEKSNKGDLCADRLRDLESMLAAAVDRPTVVFMHHPTFEVSTIPEPFQFESRESAEAFEEILARHPQVRGIYCGHVHRPYKAALGRIPAVVMTAVALDLRKGKPEPVTEKTPLYLLHEFESVDVAGAREGAGAIGA